MLVVYAKYNLDVDDRLIKAIKPFTTLLPPEGRRPLTYVALKSKVPKPDEILGWSDDRESLFVKFRDNERRRWKDEDVLAIWPARTKIDLSIRRTRLKEVHRMYKNLGIESTFWERAADLGGFDIISVQNILTAAEVMKDEEKGWSWWDFWKGLDAMGGVERWTQVAKYVNDRVKGQDPVGFSRFRVAECAVMTGYRNPPYPGFDVLEQAKGLAEGGQGPRAGVNPLQKFKEIAWRVLKMDVPSVPYVSFEDYVSDVGYWLTSGASSLGKVEVDWDGDKFKVKARKNQAAYILDLPAESVTALEWRRQVNVAITKSELGKIRIAVSSDIYNYWLMSYVTYYLHSSYLQWPGNTLEEDIPEQTRRMLAMLETVQAGWNLPFDYSGFDHQPTTDELLVISDVLIAHAARNIPPMHMSEFSRVAEGIREGFRNADLMVRDPKATIRVTGGLMSGLRWTSIVGNAWNTVMTEWARMATAGLAEPTGRWIRGDDSAITCNTYAQALLFRLGYAYVGAEGADGKFAIHHRQSEFLRVWYARRAFGYLGRAIPGLVQRKPWTPAPWDEEGVIKSVYEATVILRRRGGDTKALDAFWRGAKEVWSKRKHVSDRWLGWPRELGGLGVEPWDGKTRPVGKWPRVSPSGLTVTNMTEAGREALTNKYERWNLTPAEKETIAQKAMAATLSSDDIPEISRRMRDLATLPTDSKSKKMEVRVPAVFITEARAQAQILQGLEVGKEVIPEYMARDWAVGLFGRHKDLKQEWADASIVLRERKEPVARWMFNRHAQFGRDVKKLERWGLARFEALDWVWGETGVGVVRALHPGLMSVLGKAIARTVGVLVQRLKMQPGDLTWFKSMASQILEPKLRLSAMAETLFSW